MGRLDQEDINLHAKIALRLQELRKEIEPVQARFARKHGIDRQLLNRWENPKNERGISIPTLRRFCKTIGISLKDFFDSPLFEP